MQKIRFVPEFYSKGLILHLATSKWSYFYNSKFYITTTKLPYQSLYGLWKSEV